MQTKTIIKYVFYIVIMYILFNYVFNSVMMSKEELLQKYKEEIYFINHEIDYWNEHFINEVNKYNFIVVSIASIPALFLRLYIFFRFMPILIMNLIIEIRFGH